MSPRNAIYSYYLSAQVVTTLESIPRNSLPDMPDRIIAATALHLGLPVISRDSKMPLAGINVIW
jgi:predicted nucleic acid-binding protein